MDNENNLDNSTEKSFTSSSNDEDDNSSEQSFPNQHNQDIQERRLSSENIDNHLHTESTEHENHHHDESSHNEDHIHHSSDNNQDQTDSIEETTSHSHDDQQEQVDTSTNKDDTNIIEDNDQINNNTNSIDHQNDSDLSFNDDQLQIDSRRKSDELRPQRELDEDEIPPADISNDEIQINNSRKTSQTELTDTRPLTSLETPYEHHHEDMNSTTTSSDSDQNKENRPIEFLVNQNIGEIETSDGSNYKKENHSIEHLIHKNLNLNENPSEDEINNLSSSSSLPDVVPETIEDNNENFLSESDPLNDENIVKEEEEEVLFTEGDFPPLPTTSTSVEQNLHSESTHLLPEDFPPLPPPINPVEEILHTESNHLNSDQHPQHPLFTKHESVLPEPEDILGNKTLIKQTIVKGEDNTNPTRSTMVTISYTLSLVDNLTSNIRLIETISNERFFVSEHDIIPAIDISVQKMNRGERATIDADVRLCYGDIGCEDKQIPPITTLNPYKMKIDLELHDWISPIDIEKLSIDERLYWGDKKRQMGNFYFRRQDYPISLQCYHGALRFLDTDNNSLSSSSDLNQRSILNDKYIQVQNNVAQVNLHLDKYDACLNAVNNVLKHDSKNVKALFRQGKALFKLGMYEQAIQPLKLLQQIQRENSTTGSEKDQVNEMISISENKLASYQKNEKEIYRRMFQPTPTTTTSNQQRQTKNINQIDKSNTNWWPYLALGGAVLATVGFVTFMKYRKSS